MRASDLRHLIEFQQPVTTSDGMGGQVESSWDTTKKCWAKIMPIGSNISYENGQTRGVKNHEITIRYQKDVTLTHETRIKWGDRILTPGVTINTDNLKHWMMLEATEKV